MQQFRITEHINKSKKPVPFNFGYNAFWMLRPVELEVRCGIDLSEFAKHFSLTPSSIKMIYYRPNTDVVMVSCYYDQYRVYSPNDGICGVYRGWEDGLDAFNYFTHQPKLHSPSFDDLVPDPAVLEVLEKLESGTFEAGRD